MAKTVDLTKRATTYTGIQDRKTLAQIRAKFLEEDTNFIRECLIADLRGFVDDADISRMKLITLDFFIPAFLDKICNVYDNAPIVKYTDKKVESDAFNSLLNETRFFLMLQDNFTRLRMHGTVIPYVRYNESLDKVWIDLSLNEGTAIVVNHPTHIKEPVIIIYPVVSGEETNYYVWEKETGYHYYIKEEPKIDKENARILNEHKFPVGKNPDLEGPGYWPFVDYHYHIASSRFWGNGMDALVELVRVINMLLTVTTDDTVQETIRILILNFDPTGTKGQKGQMKSGLRHPFFKDNGFGAEAGPDGKILSADLYNDDVVKLIDNLTDIISNTHSIDNVIKQSINSNLSGIAIKLKSEPLLQRWAKDINILRYYDKELINTLIKVHNYHRKNNSEHKQIPESITDGISLDYQKPNMVSDEKEDYDLERLKWEDGTSSPVIYIMQQNPELSEQDAIERIKKNLSDTKKFGEAVEISIEQPKDKENLNL